jgi:hypothetical protein
MGIVHFSAKGEGFFRQILAPHRALPLSFAPSPRPFAPSLLLSFAPSFAPWLPRSLASLAKVDGFFAA